MNHDGMIELAERAKDEGRSLLDGVIRQGAQKILQAALEVEIEEHMADMGVGVDGRRLAVRNGRLPSREILTGAGVLSVEGLDALPYLHGISTGQMAEALEALVGASAKGLSAATVARLTQCWETEHREWHQQSLATKRYVYW